VGYAVATATVREKRCERRKAMRSIIVKRKGDYKAVRANFGWVFKEARMYTKKEISEKGQ
jgi:hypothetical protein